MPVDADGATEAAARGARAGRVVVREEAGARRLERARARRAREAARDRDHPIVVEHHARAALAARPRLLERLLQAAPPRLVEGDTVDHDLDRRARGLARLELVDAADLAADAQATVAVARELLAQHEVRLGAVDPGGVGDDRAAGRGGERLAGGARGVELLGGDAAVGAVRHRLAREERREVRLELRHGGHRRAARFDRRAPVDRDAGRDGLDLIGRRPVEALEELASIRRERLDEATLPLGVDGVDREARLARARGAGERDELARPQLEVDALEVVGPGSPNDRGAHQERTLWCAAARRPVGAQLCGRFRRSAPWRRRPARSSAWRTRR